VDLAETQTELCYKANCFGVENLALATKALGTKFVTISTDYVFDGEKNGFYTEEDETNPLGIYGKSKLEGEIRALNANENCIVVRSGWIYGEGGTNFLSVLPELLSSGKKVKAIADSFGTPTYARDLASRLRDLAAIDVSGIFHIANSGEGTSYEEFAREICRLSSIDYSRIESVFTEDMKRAAPRPRNSRLRSVRTASSGVRPLRGWRAALSEFLEYKKKRPF
jgi:dTDP-4-dehydrorhamnose reductase